MSNRGNCIISIIILILGGVFTGYYNHENFTRWIVLLCGLTFVVPAAISLLNVLFPPKEGARSTASRIVQLICGMGGLGLGLCIIFLPDVFRSLLFYPFGALLIIGGLLQEFQISHKYRPVGYPWWLHVAPVALLVAGVVLLCVPALHDLAAERWMILMVGIGAILFGINGIVITIMARRHYRLAKRARQASATLHDAGTSGTSDPGIVASPDTPTAVTTDSATATAEDTTTAYDAATDTDSNSFSRP